jgi:predicted dehydrogenase
MTKAKVAVIGVGYLGQHHARVLSQLPNVELIGVVDIDAAKASEVAKNYSTNAYADFRDLLDKADAFCIATPTDTHYSIAVECMRHNKDLFIEKPIASNTTEAWEIADTVAKKGLILQVGHIERFNPVFKAALDIVHTPMLIEAERVSPFLQRAARVDVVKDLMIHDIDLILALLDAKGIETDIKSLSAYGLSMVTNKIDLAYAHIEFALGLKALIKASRIERDKKRQMTIYEEAGYLRLDFSGHSLRAFVGEGRTFTEKAIDPTEEPLRLELMSFVSCVSDRRPPPVSAIDGLKALEVAERIIKTIEVVRQ